MATLTNEETRTRIRSRDAHGQTFHELSSGQFSHLMIAPGARQLLAAAGLVDFDSIMKGRSGECLRVLRDRENWRLRLTGPDGAVRVAYLKKHRTRSIFDRLAVRFVFARRPSPARVEAENAIRLAAGGAPTLEVLAYGERWTAAKGAESFLLTADLEGFTQLDHFLSRRFEITAAGTARDSGLAKLVDGVADLAARFHRLGYNHRDFYCCHFFIRELADEEFEINLIDLQRVQFRTRWRRRWIVKDLAQLAYSAPRNRVTNTMRMRFFKRYLGTTRLDPAAKKLIHSVLQKQRWLERKHGAHP